MMRFRRLSTNTRVFTSQQLHRLPPAIAFIISKNAVCRWLLIAHDSARSDTFLLTHEFLAMMLGVQRAGVSVAAAGLQKAGLIQYRHGQVTITNRSGLEDAACECYRVMGTEFDKLFRTRKKS